MEQPSMIFPGRFRLFVSQTYYGKTVPNPKICVHNYNTDPKHLAKNCKVFAQALHANQPRKICFRSRESILLSMQRVSLDFSIPAPCRKCGCKL